MSNFQQELNKLEKNIIFSWFQATGHKIGLSIQIDNEVQDENSTTRDIKACEINGYSEDLINEYCQGILSDESNIENCNLLDFHLKDYAKGNEIKNFGCRCHKGVTNFLIPYRYNNSNPTFYIFIGQFMLKPLNEEFKDKFIEFENIELIEATSLKDSQKKHIYPSPFVQVDDIPKNEDSAPIIAYIDFTEYVAYKRFVLYSFSIWIKDYFEERTIFEKYRSIVARTRTARQIYKPTESLQNFMKYINVSSILYHLEDAKLTKVTHDEYRKNQMLNSLTEIVRLHKNNLKIFNQEFLKELKDFSLIYKQDSGRMGKEEYINKGNNLLKKIAANVKN